MVDIIVVYKHQRVMEIYGEGKLIKKWPISLGFSPRGHKIIQGDGRTPEGFYKIGYKNSNSRFYLSLGLNYPRPVDQQRADALDIEAGGHIMIHGQGNSPRKGDWTEGCIALNNQQIAELWPMVAEGTAVMIFP